MKFKNILVASVVLTASILGVSANAYEPGDMIIRGGLAYVSPNDSSSALSANNSAVGNSGVSVGSGTQLGLTGVYMVTKSVGVELLASTPFTHALYGKGAGLAAYGLQNAQLGEVKHLPPTVSTQYYFNNSSIVTPYVGVGINYTWVMDESVSPVASTVLKSSSMHLSNSWGFTEQVGVDIKATDKLIVNAAVWHMDIDTTGHIRNTVLGDIKVDAHVDPWVYMLGAGYKF